MVHSEPNTTEPKPLYGMFTDIPRRYDLVNRIITLGLDKRWREQAARECIASQPQQILDLCCGTGDLAINIARLAKFYVGITGLDYSQPMLDIAAKKAEQLAKVKITFTRSDAATLPFDDEYFDTVGISFAFRNLTYKNPLSQYHLAEIWRVLKPGGRCVIIETSQPEQKIVRMFLHLYLRSFVFWVGYWLSGNRAAFRYLSESAARFYTPGEVKELLLMAGFSEVVPHPLFLGAVSLYVAVK
ncbi:MAG: ubiquinone/menaquinone biosynthesis methyltransferase [Chloroflexota bacterium]